MPSRDHHFLELPWRCHLAALVARLWTAFTLLIFHVLDGVSRGWAYLWRDEAWPNLKAAADIGVPAPQVVLPAVAGTLLLACFACIIGIFSRVAAFVILLILLAVLWFLGSPNASGESVIAAGPATIEAAVALLIGPLMVLFLGGGKWSIDAFFQNPARPR